MAIGARTIATKPDVVSVPDTPDNNPGGMSSYTGGVPDYMQPYVGDESHLSRGTFSPDLLHDTGEAQLSSPGTYPPMQIERGGNQKIDTETMRGQNVKQPDSGVPIDPLTGNPAGGIEPEERVPGFSPSDLVRANLAQVGLLRDLLTELRSQRAQIRCGVYGARSIDAVQPYEYSFQIAGKNVVVAKVFVQNNSSIALTIELDGVAGPGTISVAAGGGYQTFDVKCNRLSLMLTAAGTVQVNNPAVAGVVIRGWSNPEYTAMRGQA